MQKIRIRGGHVVDPAAGTDGIFDVVTNGKYIEGIFPIGKGPEADLTIDAEGLYVFPGLVDMHVHFREPGQEHKETIETGAMAAAHGGVTSVMAMPNTTPPLSDPELIRACVLKAEDVPCHVYPIASVTRGMKGEELTDIPAAVAAGAKAISEDGKSVLDAALLEDAMKIASDIAIPVISHCEDPALVRGGVMNDDENAKRLGLPGICNASEDVIIARDALLAAETGAQLHICHCSTAGSAAVIKAAKENGVRITAETCPHYLILTSDDITENDGRFKMNPPLRTKEDREVLRRALADDTIDVIVTDHAPHAKEEKAGGFMKSAFGIVGLETSAALIYTELVRTGVISLAQMILKMSTRPAEICGLDAGTLRAGAPADIAVFDLDHPYVIDPDTFYSKSKNTPFAGRTVYGKCKYTVCGGRLVYEDKEDGK